MKTIMFYPKVIIPVVSIIQSEDKSNKGNFEDFLELVLKVKANIWPSKTQNENVLFPSIRAADLNSIKK